MQLQYMCYLQLHFNKPLQHQFCNYESNPFVFSKYNQPNQTKDNTEFLQSVPFQM